MLKSKKYLIVAVVVLWCSLGVSASVSDDQPQNTPGRLTILPDGVAEKQWLSPNLLIFTDPSGKLMLTDLLQEQRQKQFLPVDNPEANFGFRSETFWGKVTLVNTGSRPVKRTILHPYGITDYISVFVPTDKGYHEIKDGDLIVARPEAIAFRMINFTITIPPGAHDYYFRLQTEGSARLDLQLHSADTIAEFIVVDTIFVFLLYGTCLSLLVYNLLQYLVIRNPMYFYYILWIFWMIIANTYYYGWIGPMLWTQSFADLSNIVMGVACNLSFFGGSTFVIRFLELQKYDRPMFFTMRAAQLVNLLGVVMAFIEYKISVPVIFVGSTMVFGSLIVFAGIRSCRRGASAGVGFTIAWATAVVGNVVSFLAMGKVLPITAGTTHATFIGSTLELLMLSWAIGTKIRYQLTSAAETIQEFNLTLERRIEDRTRDIRTILRSLPQGTCIIDDPSGAMGAEYSDYLVVYAGREPQLGEDAMGLLFKDTDVSEQKIAQVRSAIIAIMGEQSIFYEINQGYLPRRFTRAMVKDPSLQTSVGKSASLALGRDADLAIEFFELDWTPIVDDEGWVRKILVSLRNVTEAYQLRRESAKQTVEMAMIRAAVHLTPERYSEIMHGALDLVNECGRLLTTTMEKEQGEQLKRLLHTVKASLVTLELDEMATLVHGVESQMANAAPEGFLASLPELVGERLGELSQHLSELSARLHQLFPRDRFQGGEGSLLLPKELVQKLAQDLPASPVGPRSVQKFQQLVQAATHRTLSQLIGESLASLPRLAEALDKPPPEVVVEDDGILFHPRYHRVLQHCFSHLIRNAVDHGLEAVAEREAQNKPDEGFIHIHCHTHDHGFEIAVEDDGRGLAIEVLRELGSRRGLLRPDETDPAVIAEVVFQGGATTKQQSSLISGGGVGLDAVRQFLQEHEADITIRFSGDATGPYVPFAFVLVLPQHWAMAATHDIVA